MQIVPETGAPIDSVIAPRYVALAVTAVEVDIDIFEGHLVYCVVLFILVGCEVLDEKPMLIEALDPPKYRRLGRIACFR